MARRSYNAADLERSLASLEDRHGITSDKFYEMYLAHEVPESIPHFHSYIWASFYRDVRRMHSGLAEQVERTLAPA